MAFVSKRDDVVSNIKTFEGYLHSKKSVEKEYALNAVLTSENVVIYKVNGENHFGPCRFFVFKKNSLEELERNLEIEDKEAANVMTKIIGASFTNGMTEQKYLEYAKTLSKDVPKVDRKFWRVKDERGKNFDLKM
jgi:hypothetical protein